MDRFAPLVWLCLAIIFAVIEMATVQLVSVWLALGALAGLILSLFSLPLAVQLLAFVLVSAVTLAFTRPFVKKVLRLKKVSTNADRVLGQAGVVTEKIDNDRGTGRVSVDGLSWRARSLNGALLEEGCRVVAVKIEGVTLLVEKTA